jgi:hypothetical protein
MKVGDRVRQNDKAIKMTVKSGKQLPISCTTGIVIEIRDQLPPKKEETEQLIKILSYLGRQVDVLWSNGKLSKNFAENSLRVLNEK